MQCAGEHDMLPGTDGRTGQLGPSGRLRPPGSPGRPPVRWRTARPAVPADAPPARRPATGPPPATVRRRRRCRARRRLAVDAGDPVQRDDVSADAGEGCRAGPSPARSRSPRSSRAGSPRSPGSASRKPPGASAGDDETGQCACRSTPWLTEPSSMPARPPCPRVPTTSRLAVRLASTSSCTGRALGRPRPGRRRRGTSRSTGQGCARRSGRPRPGSGPAAR